MLWKKINIFFKNKAFVLLKKAFENTVFNQY